VAGGTGTRTAVAVVLGVLSVATMPVAVFATRYSGSYDLVHAALAIPVGLVMGALAVRSARPARVRLDRGGWSTAARVLGWAGIWLAGAALVAVAFYGILTYLGNRS
jgi:hypothetical protein